MTLLEQPDQSEPKVPPKEAKFKGYFKVRKTHVYNILSHSHQIKWHAIYYMYSIYCRKLLVETVYAGRWT